MRSSERPAVPVNSTSEAGQLSSRSGRDRTPAISHPEHRDGHCGHRFKPTRTCHPSPAFGGDDAVAGGNVVDLPPR